MSIASNSLDGVAPGAMPRPLRPTAGLFDLVAPEELIERILAHLRAQGRHRGAMLSRASDLDVAPLRSGSDPSKADMVLDAASQSMEQLVRDHADAVYRVALSVTRDPSLAEDASQDALIKAWQALPSYRGDAPLRNWVLRIAHTTSISLLRKRRDEVRAPTDLPERSTSSTTVETQVQDRLAIDRFEQALMDLDATSRSIVVLREVEGLSYDEMSDVLQLPMPTIKTRLLRARRQLALALEGWRP